MKKLLLILCCGLVGCGSGNDASMPGAYSSSKQPEKMPELVGTGGAGGSPAPAPAPSLTP